MVKSKSKPRTLVIRKDPQRRAISSPLRLEVIGLFLDRTPLSVAQIAQRMGRPATAIHYHVRLMEKAGLLRRAGDRRSGRRSEALYVPVADIFKVEQPRDTAAGDTAASVKTLSTAFRMAVGDLKAALQDPATRDSGPQRTCMGGRFHCRLSRAELAQLNRHLNDIEKLLSRTPKNTEPSPNDIFVSLTLALMPLRNREVPS